MDAGYRFHGRGRRKILQSAASNHAQAATRCDITSPIQSDTLSAECLDRFLLTARLHQQPGGTAMSYKALKAFATALAAAAIATVTGTASAKFVGSEFDPIFFVGFGQFLVPDTPSPCQYLGTGFFAVNGANSCTGVLLLDVTVNASDGANSAVLSLPPPTPDANAVTGMVLDPNSGSLVVGMDTGLIPISCTGALCAGDDWFIQWNSGLSVGNPSLSGLAQTVKLWRDTCNDGCLEEFPADQVFFTPEPGSLALLFGALGAGWIARRRKNTA